MNALRIVMVVLRSAQIQTEVTGVPVAVAIACQIMGSNVMVSNSQWIRGVNVSTSHNHEVYGKSYISHSKVSVQHLYDF